jgi:hypothetical protein
MLTNLKRKIRPLPRPAHLLRFVYPAVYQKIGRPFGDRKLAPQSGTVMFGGVDQPGARFTASRLERRRPKWPAPISPQLRTAHLNVGNQRVVIPDHGN